MHAKSIYIIKIGGQYITIDTINNKDKLFY